MKTILLSAGSVVALSIATLTATTAFADHGRGIGKGPLANISIPVDNAGGIAACLIDRMDRDENGLIDDWSDKNARDADEEQSIILEDMQAKAAARFARMDRNGDGQLDDADKAIVMAEHAECASLIGLDLSAMGDDDNDRRRGKGMGSRGGMKHGGAYNVVLQNIDKDSLSGLDVNGLATAIQTQLQAMDTDADGVVSAQELVEAMGERKGRRHGENR